VNYYPTDVLLAVENAERQLRTGPTSELAGLLEAAELGSLAGLLHTDELTEGLDELLCGTQQFPWQPRIDSDDVYELAPVGTIVLDDHRPGNTLRGLLLGWATGNAVTVRTAHRACFWAALTDLLRRPDRPLPGIRIVDADRTVPGVRVDVPDLLPVPSGGDALPAALSDPALYASGHNGGRNEDAAVMEVSFDVRRPHAAGQFTGTVLRLDCRAAWAQKLLRRTCRVGTSLSAARAGRDGLSDGRLDAKVRYLLGRARRTPYYRDLVGLPEAQGLSDLARLPILEKEALTAHSLPRSRDLSSGGVPSGEVLRSGATTGAHRYIVYSRADWNNMVREAVPLFYAMGLERGDRLINALFGGGLYGGLTTTLTEFTRMPIECYTTAQDITVDTLLLLVRDFGANALIGVPTLILPLLREAKQLEPDLRLEKILYLGTAMSESDKAWLREHLGTCIVASVLAVNDGAQLGYQCSELSGALHHINDDFNYLEVVDDAGEPVPDGQAGQLIVTSLQKFESPLIRYRVGDRGRVFTYDCACGVTGRVLEYHGRADGLIRVKGEPLLYDEIRAELDAFGISELQAQIDSRSGKETLILRTESSHDLAPDALRRHLSERFKVLSDLHIFDDGLDVFDFHVECHPLGTLDRNPVSGKIRPVIDRRLAAG
jgi:phenylacetate-coenzyme A ligase PaaK-like adenylate-forming protein